MVRFVSQAMRRVWNQNGNPHGDTLKLINPVIREHYIFLTFPILINFFSFPKLVMK